MGGGLNFLGYIFKHFDIYHNEEGFEMIHTKTINPREPTFELNRFNEPMEVTGPDAWVRDVVAMAFYEPGTFTDDPGAGVNINGETYTFTEESAGIIRSRLTENCDRYLSDVPIEDLIVATYYWESAAMYVTAITMQFRYNQTLKSYAAYVAIVDHTLRYIVNQLT